MDTYTVEEPKEEIRKLTKAGEVETWYRIWATSKGGTRFHVDVSETQLSQAPHLLATRAKEIDAI